MEDFTLKNVAIYIFMGLVVPFLCLGLWQRLSPKVNYEKGFQAGLENAEASCFEFDKTTYIGSYNYIKTHDPELYRSLGGKEE